MRQPEPAAELEAAVTSPHYPPTASHIGYAHAMAAAARISAPTRKA